MVKTYDGVWNGRSDYAKYTLSSCNENRPSGFFCANIGYILNPYWDKASSKYQTSAAKAGLDKSSGRKWYYCSITFDYNDLASLRKKNVKKVELAAYSTLTQYVDVDMKADPSSSSMSRCDKDGTLIKATKLGTWSSDSPNYVSSDGGVCTFDLTNDIDGNFAGVPKYGYCFGRDSGYMGASYLVTMNSGESSLTTAKRATLCVVTNERESTLSFDSQGGSAVSSVTGAGVEGNCKLKIPEDAPALSNRTFKGWSLSADGEPMYHPGDTIEIEEDTTLYAIWNKTLVHVTFLPSGTGTGGWNTIAYAGDEINIIDLNFFIKKPGYAIDGYSDTDGGEKQYSIGDRYTVPDTDSFLYAVWKPGTSIITYDANGGKYEPVPQIKTGGQDLTLSEDEPKRMGYKFMGWSMDSWSPYPVFQPGDTYSLEGDNTLYAVWKELDGLIRYATHEGVKVAKPFIKVSGKLVRCAAYVMTEEGLRPGT